MDIQSVVFDLYQSVSILGIKVNALISTLSEDEKKIYAKSFEDQISKNKSTLEAGLTNNQVEEILAELRKF